MHIFLIGATGFVGSHIAARLIAGGYRVSGLARSESAADRLRDAHVEPVLGDIDDLQILTAQALACDATIFTPQVSPEQEQATVLALLDAFAGTGKTFIFTSGTGVLGQRTNGEWSEESFAEDDPFVPSKYISLRPVTELMVREAANRGVRAMVVRPPSIWGNGCNDTVTTILDSIEKTGKACYVGRGQNLYTNVHVEDLADLYHLALEKGVAGALYHASAGELNYRTIAEYVARQQGTETQSVTPEQAVEIWGKFTMLIVMSVCSRTRSPRSRRELGWTPTRLDMADAILAGQLNGKRDFLRSLSLSGAT